MVANWWRLSGVLVAFWWSLGGVAFAQGPNLKVPYAVQFCWDGKESDGTTNAVGPFQVQVTIDAANQPLVALPTPLGAAGTNGCAAASTPYKLTGYISSKGAHTVKGAIVSPDGTGNASVPFSFVVVGNPPSTPTNVQAVQ